MKAVFLLLQFLAGHTVAAQTSWPPFQSLRYEENYSFLRHDTAPTVYQKLKYGPLSSGGDAYVSIGGDLRYQYFFIQNEDWGMAPKDSNGFLLSRLLVHADLHTSPQFRLFVQVQSSLAANKESGTSPIDENGLDLHQAFADLSLFPNAVFRVGRQELSYGSQRLVSVRELPNNRQAFDAAKFSVKRPRYHLDLFYSRFVQSGKGMFDDRSGRDLQFWGSYQVLKDLPFLQNADLYYFGLSKSKVVFEDGNGEEKRHSIGTRLWGKKAGWRYDAEAVFQFGRLNRKNISAWTVSLNTGYLLQTVALEPEIGLKTELISGDAKKEDGKLQTFNPLFPRGAYFGLAALIGPSNLVDVHPSVLLQLFKNKLTWSVDYDVFWRHRIADGIYAPNVSPIAPADKEDKRFIGQQFSTDLNFTPNRFLMSRLEVTWFRSGAYLKAVNLGKNILLVGITAQFRF